jgi:hypothetical protein
VAPLSDEIDSVDTHLTLKGLRIAYTLLAGD